MNSYQTNSVDIESFNKNAKAKVEKIISESPDMITALESVGAMYGIPSTHFTVQPELKSLRVVNDNVITPPDVRPNTKAIVCAIGGVLDNISQRVNDKLDNLRSKESDDAHTSQNADPNKGEVLKRFTDDNGDEIIIYKSGLMDLPNTKEAHLKADEIKKTVNLPDDAFDKFIEKKKKEDADKEYFGEAYDIRLKTNANISEDMFVENDPSPINIQEMIGESAFHIDLVSHYNDTDYLGYEMLQEQGFDFVKPTEAFAMEAAGKSVTKINPEDIKHMKFDNTHLTKAIECFNKARAEQEDAGKGNFDITKLTSSQNYKDGIKEIEQQFDCHISLHFKDDVHHPTRNDLFTMIFDHQHADKIRVSKAKGFQLGGLPITLVCVNNAIDEEMTTGTDKNLFGQFMCSSICHEIFHNIANAIRCRTNMFIYTSTSAMGLALSTDDAAKRREVFSRFADTITVDGSELSKFEKKQLVKKLCYISAIAGNTDEISKLSHAVESSKDSNEADREIEKLIKYYEDSISKYEKKLPHSIKKGDKFNKNPSGYKMLNKIATGLCSTIVGTPIGLPMMKLIPNRADAAISKAYSDYLSNTNKEEYYCDMFAGMYNLPLTFAYGFSNRNFVANDISEDKLSYLADLEKKIYQLRMSSYPTINERNYAAYQIAKTILNGEEKISPEAKAYCQWVVDNYSKIESTNVANNYNKTTFDPNEAKNLDEHVQNIITNNGIAVTESYV
jgi:hypothetical protein